MANTHNNFKEFRDNLTKFNRVAGKKATTRLRRCSMKALKWIVEGTPVETGCCRGNWVVSVGQLGRQFDQSKTDKRGGKTRAAGEAVINSVELGTDVLIANSCPYVIPLENGWSTQKHAGRMIHQPLARLRKELANGEI